MPNKLETIIKDTAAENGWSLREVARRSGLPHATVQKICSGQAGVPRHETLKSLAKGLGVSRTLLLEAAAESSGYTQQRVQTKDLDVVVAALYDLDQDQIRQIKALVQAMIKTG